MATRKADNKKEFGNLIRELRKKGKITQEGLADRLGVTRQTIVNIEKGIHVPRVDILDDLWMILKSPKLIEQYIHIQNDRVALRYLADILVETDIDSAKRVMKKVIRLCLQQKKDDLAVTSVFQIIIWDLIVYEKTNRRLIEYVVKTFDALDQEDFISLLDTLYSICFNKGKQFEAFIAIAENVINKLHVENEKSFMLWYHYAQALYYKGEMAAALEACIKAFHQRHVNIQKNDLAKVHSRLGLICLQIKSYERALEAFLTSIELGNGDLHKYGYLNIGRTYYMLEKYDQALYYWNKMFNITSPDDPLRINAMNDIAVMRLKMGDIQEAITINEKIEEMLQQVIGTDWSMYKEENLLYERTRALILLETNFKEGVTILIEILEQLEKSHLEDEYQLTKDFLFKKMCSQFDSNNFPLNSNS